MYNNVVNVLSYLHHDGYHPLHLIRRQFLVRTTLVKKIDTAHSWLSPNRIVALELGH